MPLIPNIIKVYCDRLYFWIEKTQKGEPDKSIATDVVLTFTI